MQSSSLADLSVSELTERIGSNSVTPGAGAAAAVTVALAAACACKAVSISLKHSDDAQLRRALGRFQKLSRCALRGADEDAFAFAAWVRDKDAHATHELIDSEESMAHLINALLVTLSEVEPLVRPNMAGDLIAATSLARAAKTIYASNKAETKAERD
jgi:formiminotetrahydrofolate cyclodeaminase